ncbi:MAG TPA: tetratricopeptide repeat protein [Verrucomicrobiae bacterium]
MKRLWLWLALAGFFPVITASSKEIPLAQRAWFAARTAHFNVFSCGHPQSVFKVAAQFEQFCEAYSSLAGAQAVASPPISVIVFPDHESMKPFLPLYHGQPENLAGFFNHGTDENLIVLALPGAHADNAQFNVIFHEYTHLLLRRNDRIWPLWLKEGMAEIYSTFTTSGNTAYIALPIQHHLQLLASQPLMPLAELFAVKNDSPDYNERDRQGLFYAESWLLAHYLTAGDNAVLKARFRQFTPLLQQGQTPLQAFTNALQISLPALEKELRRYLENKTFTGISFVLPDNVAAPKNLATRGLTPVEIYFRLGDELLRIGRLDDAGKMFAAAQAFAPASPLPYEGLGLLAVRRNQTDEAVRQFHEAIQRGSVNFLAYYFYAWGQFHRAAETPDAQGGLPKAIAAEIHSDLLQSFALMSDFGPAHELFGIVELARGNVTVAELHLQRAVQLEPENFYYQLALANAQLQNGEKDAAHRALNALCQPNVETKVRAQAEELLQKLN